MAILLRRLWTALPLLALVLGVVGCFQPTPTGGERGAGGDYLFCFWNTENFFDDKLNGWKNRPDEEFDEWFARTPGVFQQKVKNLTEVLARLNEGKGPDILALAEVETEDAAQALMESLNRAIKPGTPPYKHVLMKDPHGGRHIATAIITRLPVNGDRTQLLGRRLRILEGHIDSSGKDLVVMATHWTSRVTEAPKKGAEEEGPATGREKYADLIYGRFKAMYRANPNVALLICGDFNDNPDDTSVTQHLHATGDRKKVLAGGDEPALYDLFANVWQEKRGTKGAGTHRYGSHWFLFDQIVVSPGLINGSGGWQCEIDTARIVEFPDRLSRKVKGEKVPVAFGTPRDRTPLESRGVSDHLPVTVRLMVSPAARP
jgi:endonuclease/exonuclease/phosphatase family metal-dependent hydrolase